MTAAPDAATQRPAEASGKCVVHFDPARITVIECGSRRFFLLEGGDCGRRWVVDARCRHRGGPLDKAERCRNGGALSCPWHDCITPVRRLTREAVPAVFRPGGASLVLAPVDQPVRLLSRTIRANRLARRASPEPNR
ncbi:MAG: Rieske 2Fe-2S domain-containing protein [Deinococcus-Thermus bacterium]|jgi:hypothetical protein|nr:Rieske 2Fe-2S domain-containing protein [Deinococcota bacterium]